MRTINLIITAILVVAVIWAAGCGNNSLSPVSSDITNNNSADTEYSTNLSSFHGSIKLAPNQTYVLNYQSTGLRVFNSILVSDCREPNTILEIVGYYDDEQIILGCSNTGFQVYSISMRNISSRILNLNVSMTGSERIYPSKETGR